MLSIVIKEHNEGREFVQKMLQQISLLSLPINSKEVIFVTSMDEQTFKYQYNIDTDPFYRYNFPIRIIPNISSCGEAINQGGKAARFDNILFLDCHICFNDANLRILLDTQNRHPNSVVTPAIQSIEFPSCTITPNTGIGYGAAFGIAKGNPFYWIWLEKQRSDMEYPVPLVCGCVFMTKKHVFNSLDQYGGFGFTKFEEERYMRLWRLGYPSYVEPRSMFGHYFKGGNHTQMGNTMQQDWFRDRVVSLYVNIFDDNLWNQIDTVLRDEWGTEYTNGLEYAKQNYTWLRDKLRPFSFPNNINERWFIRT